MNTKILLRTINDTRELKEQLENSGFKIQVDDSKLEVEVDYSKIELFQKIIKEHLNAVYNYANVKFPDRKLNILIFPKKNFVINNIEADKNAKEWALSVGLSKPETEWTTFYTTDDSSV